MADVISGVRIQLSERLDEVIKEADQLRSLLALIDDGAETPSKPAAKPSAKKNGGGGGSKQSGGESRRDQIVDLLSAGMSPKEIASELGCNIAYVYNIRREYVKESGETDE